MIMRKITRRSFLTAAAVSGAAGAAPVTEGTLFECASLTKPLFAVLALQLADERLLALDESVPARLGGEPWSQDPDFAKITPPARSSATAPACRIGTAALCPCSLPRVRLIAIPARAIICCSTWRKNYGTISPGAVCGPCFHALSNAPLRRALDAGGGQRHFSGL